MSALFSVARGCSVSRGITFPTQPSTWMGRRQTSVLLQAQKGGKKGFGSSNRNIEDEEKRGGPKAKVRRNKLRGAPPQPGQAPVQGGGEFQAVIDLETRMQKDADDEEFNARLAVLRADTKVLVKEAAGQSDILAKPVAAFDVPVQNGKVSSIYDNPPSLVSTLFSGIGGDISDPKLKNANIGPSQVGLAVGALVLAVVILLTTGAGTGNNKRYKGVQPSQPPPDPIQEGILKNSISRLETQLKVKPGDSDALEELAVSYAKLSQFETASDLLNQLVQYRPQDAEAWRLLGETSLLSQRSPRAVEAYEKQQRGVSFLKESIASPEQPSIGDGSTTSSKRVARPYDSVSLELLLAKTYNGWRGHDKEALSTYDSVVANHPEDFRGFLARGVYLKENGRRGESDKMFMQAKFYAPESRKAFVQRMSGISPLIDLPDNN
eukprot:gene21866-28898_t